ncbi:hypothetical protein DFA_06718 [Cavenderia fasciculata]|uniref:CHAT domain-containing protein n=1 Tax=Cavenderia fasciculata TaxID=261658 RepID=F4Q231_CACFS|nr:uncharacterized protein DFA_06718 [Cavenderia fasciculata]EGG18051.1 hypothetical protein DFA_06718 [Cavenderia fasciculata]|eukprot:XP_004356944.1 hypothetical protein DFA_06718 [Cavenderia fasciculata]
MTEELQQEDYSKVLTAVTEAITKMINNNFFTLVYPLAVEGCLKMYRLTPPLTEWFVSTNIKIAADYMLSLLSFANQMWVATQNGANSYSEIFELFTYFQSFCQTYPDVLVYNPIKVHSILYICAMNLGHPDVGQEYGQLVYQDILSQNDWFTKALESGQWYRWFTVGGGGSNELVNIVENIKSLLQLIVVEWDVLKANLLLNDKEEIDQLTYSVSKKIKIIFILLDLERQQQQKDILEIEERNSLFKMDLVVEQSLGKDEIYNFDYSSILSDSTGDYDSAVLYIRSCLNITTRQFDTFQSQNYFQRFLQLVDKLESNTEKVAQLVQASRILCIFTGTIDLALQGLTMAYNIALQPPHNVSPDNQLVEILPELMETISIKIKNQIDTSMTQADLLCLQSQIDQYHKEMIHVLEYSQHPKRHFYHFRVSVLVQDFESSINLALDLLQEIDRNESSLTRDEIQSFVGLIPSYSPMTLDERMERLYGFLKRLGPVYSIMPSWHYANAEATYYFNTHQYEKAKVCAQKLIDNRDSQQQDELIRSYTILHGIHMFHGEIEEANKMTTEIIKIEKSKEQTTVPPMAPHYSYRDPLVFDFLDPSTVEKCWKRLESNLNDTVADRVYTRTVLLGIIAATHPPEEVEKFILTDFPYSTPEEIKQFKENKLYSLALIRVSISLIERGQYEQATKFLIESRKNILSHVVGDSINDKQGKKLMSITDTIPSFFSELEYCQLQLDRKIEALLSFDERRSMTLCRTLANRFNLNTKDSNKNNNNNNNKLLLSIDEMKKLSSTTNSTFIVYVADHCYVIDHKGVNIKQLQIKVKIISNFTRAFVKISENGLSSFKERSIIHLPMNNSRDNSREKKKSKSPSSGSGSLSSAFANLLKPTRQQAEEDESDEENESGDENEYENEIQEYYRFRSDQSPSLSHLTKKEELVEKLKQWYSELIEPIEEYLPSSSNDRTLVFVPNENLSNAPFSALIDKNGQYLVERFPISTTPSLSLLNTLSHLQHSNNNNNNNNNNNVLLVGNPIGSGLDFTEVEVNKCQQLFQQSEYTCYTLLHENANLTMVRSILENTRLQHIHFACHGGFNGKSNFSSFKGSLELCRRKNGKPAKLFSEDIIQLVNGIQSHTVFLSCCHSGKGNNKQQGLIGLVWSFHCAGALSVVASHWELPDTPLTMTPTNDSQTLIGVLDKLEFISNNIFSLPPGHQGVEVKECFSIYRAAPLLFTEWFKVVGMDRTTDYMRLLLNCAYKIWVASIHKGDNGYAEIFELFTYFESFCLTYPKLVDGDQNEWVHPIHIKSIISLCAMELGHYDIALAYGKLIYQDMLSQNDWYTKSLESGQWYRWFEIGNGGLDDLAKRITYIGSLYNLLLVEWEVFDTSLKTKDYEEITQLAYSISKKIKMISILLDTVRQQLQQQQQKQLVILGKEQRVFQMNFVVEQLPLRDNYILNKILMNICMLSAIGLNSMGSNTLQSQNYFQRFLLMVDKLESMYAKIERLVEASYVLCMHTGTIDLALKGLGTAYNIITQDYQQNHMPNQLIEILIYLIRNTKLKIWHQIGTISQVNVSFLESQIEQYHKELTYVLDFSHHPKRHFYQFHASVSEDLKTSIDLALQIFHEIERNESPLTREEIQMFMCLIPNSFQVEPDERIERLYGYLKQLGPVYIGGYHWNYANAEATYYFSTHQYEKARECSQKMIDCFIPQTSS